MRCVELLGKPIAESRRPLHSHGVYGHPMAGPHQAWHVHQRPGNRHAHGLASAGDRSACWSSQLFRAFPRSAGFPCSASTDVLLVEGGDAAYLCHWLWSARVIEVLALDTAHWFVRSTRSAARHLEQWQFIA